MRFLFSQDIRKRSPVGAPGRGVGWPILWCETAATYPDARTNWRALGNLSFRLFVFVLGSENCCNAHCDLPDEAINWLGQGLIWEIPAHGAEGAEIVRASNQEARGALMIASARIKQSRI